MNGSKLAFDVGAQCTAAGLRWNIIPTGTAGVGAWGSEPWLLKSGLCWFIASFIISFYHHRWLGVWHFWPGWEWSVWTHLIHWRMFLVWCWWCYLEVKSQQTVILLQYNGKVAEMFGCFQEAVEQESVWKGALGGKCFIAGLLLKHLLYITGIQLRSCKVVRILISFTLTMI